MAGCRSSASAIHGALSDFSSFHFSCSRITSSTRRVRLCAPRREALTARSVVRHQQVPLRAAQSGTHRVLPPPLGNRRLPKARRGDRFRRARAADQYPQKPAWKQTAKENRWEEWGPVLVHVCKFLDKSSVAQFLDRGLKGRLHFPWTRHNSVKRQMQYSC